MSTDHQKKLGRERIRRYRQTTQGGEKDRMRTQEWRETPEGRKKFLAGQRRYRRKHRYGVTDEDLGRMLYQQNVMCAICGKQFIDVGDAHIDHDHEYERRTGEVRVRGLLCHNCNAGLGMFKDDIVLLEDAINYLRYYEASQQ